MKSKNSLRLVVSSIAVPLLICAAALAQSPPEHRFTANFGGGFTAMTGRVSQELDNGWNISGGAGINLANPLSVGLQFTYNGMSPSTSLLSTANAPGGTARVWSITLDPRLQLGSISRFSPYLVGGVGYYRRTVDFTRPGFIPFTIIDPFFGFLNGIVPANIVIGTTSKGGIGGNLGAGVSFGLGERAQGARFFAEARYHYANTGAIPTRMVPVTFGIRF